MILSAKKKYIEIPTNNCHAGTVARFRGDSYVAWFGGTRESADDVDIYYANMRDMDIRRVTAAEEIAHWNPVLMPRGDGLDLFFKLGKTIPIWQTMRARIGTDGAASAPEELILGDVGGRGPVKNKCLTLKSGRVLAPASLETKNPARWDPYIDISDDGGETFTKFVPIPLHRAGECAPADADKPYCVVENAGAIQPTLWQTSDGHVHALLRSSEGCILRSDSQDDGDSWCPAYKTDMPNNNSGIDLVRMDDGRVLLCANPVSANWGARSPLTLSVSLDGGDTFIRLMELEMLPGEYSYPAIVSEGCTLYIAYTWNRVKMVYWEIELEELI